MAHPLLVLKQLRGMFKILAFFITSLQSRLLTNSQSLYQIILHKVEEAGDPEGRPTHLIYRDSILI
jgi:hypothetical protein